MVFQNVQEVRDGIAKYAIKKGLGVNLKKNELNRIRAQCQKNCPWTLFISKESNNDNLIVKTYKPHHNYNIVNNNPML